MTDVIKEKLVETIDLIKLSDNSIVVLKGIPLSIVDAPKINLSRVLQNRLQHLIHLSQNNTRFISYEEFILLHPMILNQYDSVHLIENNIFLNLFPLYQEIDQSIWNTLLVHFDPESNNESEELIVGDIRPYSEVFTNCMELDGLKLVTYQEEPLDEKGSKVIRHQLLKSLTSNFEKINVTEDQIDSSSRLIEINCESDYIKFVRLILQGVDEITVVDQASEIDIQILHNRLQVISQYWGDKIQISFVSIENTSSQMTTYPECRDILKKYWGVKEFRKIQVYDLNKLEQHQKIVKSISQEQVISDLIGEVEKSQSGEHYRDLFVTAPTGSGKSVMFQIPAIYLAEKYNLMTIVISPLIGLMNDQISGLTLRKYNYARTIHSDISPIVKQDIINDINENRCHLLYISPETLLSRSDISQLIGSRQLGMIVIDEAHIVTTWGKQFRPDYWYLGDYVSKLRQTRSFVIATFTATAIYGGLENMFVETKQSLRMVSPITWLGYMRREDITISIEKVKKISNKTEYELNKFDCLIDSIKSAIMFSKKTLIYFPTVALINRFFDYCKSQELGRYVVRYHGQLHKTEKVENYELFLAGSKLVMLATKAFGMGIDIDNIEVIVHFAPTGNVCDYVQEIGRAARRNDLIGQAKYSYMRTDFKHINRLHGLSTIRKMQLVQVIGKVYELYNNKIRKLNSARTTRSQNSMLIDAESFSYIFEGPMGDQDEAINKVKSAMLMIQKDFESRVGFSPFYVRPIPLFSQGFFQIQENDQKKIDSRYLNAISLQDPANSVCLVDLSKIWERDYRNRYSFPQFKFLLYTKATELEFNQKYSLNAALSISINLNDHHADNFSQLFESFKRMIINNVREGKYYTISEITSEYSRISGKSYYFSKNVCEVMLAAINIFMKNFNQRLNARFMHSRELNSGEMNYRFESGIDEFFRWVEKGYKRALNRNSDGKLFVVNVSQTDQCREITTQLGILETLDILSFDTLGGANSQIYIYVNQTLTMKRIIDRPQYYENRLLEMINDRHNLSVEMLSFLFENDFKSTTIWDHLENYFLGIIPDSVKERCEKIHHISFDKLG